MRCRASQRRRARVHGSRQAETGSSAIHRSTSSASALRRGVAVLGLQGHRLEADRLQRPVDRRVELPRRRELAPLHGPEHLADVVALERRPAGQQAVERRAQAVDVARGPEALEVARGLLGAHVGRRAQRRAGQRLGAAAGRAGHQRSARPTTRARPGPSALARPQSTTSVSPCLPTMTLPGLMSRCSTPRLWA